MNQARVVDVHRFYRKGGIDWDKLKINFDAVIISAGVGLVANPLLREQVDGARENDVPYATYHIPSPYAGTMANQAAYYLSLYGVAEALCCIDIEPPGGGYRCVNATEAYRYIQEIEDRTGFALLVYSNPKYINEALHRPAWLPYYRLWLAQWPYEYWWLLRQYTGFESFLRKYANQYPAYVRGTDLQSNTVLWQFTCKGDAQALCASAITADPVYWRGIKDADLNVSTVEKDQFLALLSRDMPPPAPVEGDWYNVPVAERNIRRNPNAVTGLIVLTLKQGDQVQVSNIVTGMPGQWGVTVAWKRDGTIHELKGCYVYMNSLVKV
jgi:hypothetical protein